MAQFYANPYSDACRGFYFTTIEEYQEKWQAAFDTSHCEEYEIEFIDGSQVESDLFKAMHKISPFAAIEFLNDVADGMRDDELAAVYFDIEYNGEDDLDAAIKWAEDEGRPSDLSLEDYARDLVEQTGYPDNDYYYDYAALGRDLMMDWDESEQGEEPDDPTQYAVDFVEDMGGWDQIQNKDYYFDYEAFARDLEINGDVTEFTFGGSTWTIMR